MTECNPSNRQKHQHHRKSTETLLNKFEVTSSLGIEPGQTLLDAGCGNGYMAKEFAKLTGESGKVYALDPDAVSIAALLSETTGTVMEPLVGDITKPTPLKPGSIDLIYLSNVVHGFSEEQMEGFLNEIKRLLSPSGRLAILEIKKEKTPFGPPSDIRFSPEELQQAIDLVPMQLSDAGPFFYIQIFGKS